MDKEYIIANIVLGILSLYYIYLGIESLFNKKEKF